jgi:hypothetical protein
MNDINHGGGCECDRTNLTLIAADRQKTDDQVNASNSFGWSTQTKGTRG